MNTSGKTKEQLEADLRSALARIQKLESTHPPRDKQDDLSPLKSLVRLYSLNFDSLQSLFDFALEETLTITSSTVGYIYFYDEAIQLFSLYSWSRSVMPNCRILNKGTQYRLETTGIWGDAVRKRGPVVVNDFAADNGSKKGYPEGHIRIDRFLTIPIFKHAEIVAVVGVANKPGEYTDLDVKTLSLFANGVWALARQKEAEIALRVSEEKYRTVVQDQTEVISRFKPSGEFTFINDVYCKYFGVTPETMLGNTWTPVVFPDDISGVRKALERLSPDNAVIVIENRVYNALGELRWMQFVNRGFFDDAGRVVEIQSVGRDITQRKRMEVALQESSLRWRFALEGSGDGVWDWDIATNRIYFSKRCKELIGYGEEEIGDSPDEWKSRVHEDDLGRCIASLYEHLSGRSDFFEAEYRLRCKDASYKWMLSRGKVMLRNKHNKALRAIGTVSDITERKRFEKLKDEVDKIMRHDLRSHLVGIVGLPDVLLGNDRLTPREREILMTIQESGCKVMSMIDNSLSIYRMELGLYELSLAEVNIVPLLFGIASRLSNRFSADGIAFFIVLNQIAAQPSDQYLVACEENIFGSMVSNLLLNAAEASPQNDAIRVYLDDTEKTLEIINKGAVPLHIRKNFFDKYTTSGKKGGTGLGTYSAALIARTHGWTIDLDCSSPGETRIVIRFKKLRRQNQSMCRNNHNRHR